MKNTTFNLKSILAGIGFMLSIGSAQAQLGMSSGTTHCTTILDDCTQAGKVQVTFTINPGGIIPIDPLEEYKVTIKLYRGEWTPAGWGFTVTNEIEEDFKNSVVVTNPTTYKTSTFFTTSPYFIVTKNGVYRAKTTLKQNTTSNGWVDRYTTPLSPIYGVSDMPPYTSYGDIDEVAFIENMKVAPYFSYSINGKTSSSPVPTIITCPAVPLSIKNVIGGTGNPGTATITIQKGTLVAPTNTFNPGSNPVYPFTFATTNADLNLYSMFSGLSSYTGALRVSYRIPDDVCGSTTTPIVRTMTISVATASFLNDYKARNPNATSCPGTTYYKDLHTSANIVTTMPSSTDNNTFKCQLRNTKGWYGAASAGITNLTFIGSYYDVDVYEVNSSGNRLPGAPSLYLNSGTADGSENLEFNYFGNAASFSSSPLYAPYYVDATKPAKANGSGSGKDYFKDYYDHAKNLVINTTDPNALTNFSAKIFCVEVSQYPEGGCVVSSKSYFRIANNGPTGNGGNLRMISSDDDDEKAEDYTTLDIYPNPTKGELIIPVTEDDGQVSIRIMDNLGKEVYTTSDVGNGRITIEKLTAGIYFYTIRKNGEIYRGKVVKE